MIQHSPEWDEVALRVQQRRAKERINAGVAELVDALGLGPSALGVGVRVPSPAPSLFEIYCMNDVFLAKDMNLYLDVLQWVRGWHLPAEVCCGDVAGSVAGRVEIRMPPQQIPKKTNT